MKDQLSRPKLNLASVVGRAFARPTSVALLVFSGLALVVSPSVALVFLMGMLLLLGYHVSRPAIWEEAVRQREREWNSLPPTFALADNRVREAVAGIEDGARAVKALLPNLPQSVRQQLRHMEESLEGLRSCAAELVRRATWLGEFTTPERRDRARRELERLRDAAAKAPLQARPSYEAAICAREEQLRAFEEVEAERERALAKLARLAAVIDALPHRIASLSLVNLDFLTDVRDKLDQALASLERDIQIPHAVIGQALDEQQPLE